MTVALQIRDVPDDVRDTLAEVASARGQSVQAYLLDLVQREVRSLRQVDMFDRTAHLRVELDPSPAVVVREGREGVEPGDHESRQRP